MTRTNVFNSIKSEVNANIGFNNTDSMAIVLMARTFRKNNPWHSESIATASNYTEAINLVKELKEKYAKELKDNYFTISCCTTYAYFGVSGQVSNEAYDASKRY